MSKKTCPRMTQAVFSGPRWGETPLVKSLNGGDLSQLHILAAISFGCTAFAILHEERAITHQSLLSSTYYHLVGAMNVSPGPAAPYCLLSELNKLREVPCDVCDHGSMHGTKASSQQSRIRRVPPQP